MADHPDALKAALWFAEKGYGIFPVWGVTDSGACLCPKGATCTNPGKHPATKRGFKDATTDPDAIRKFMSNPGTPNYGLDLPEGHIGVDVDGDDRKRWDDLQHTLGPLPVTLTFLTPNGYHFVYLWEDEQPIPSRLQGCVVRYHQNGYFVGAGSRHASGAYYDIARPIHEPARLPDAWKEKKSNGVGTVTSLTVGGMRPEDVAEGHRHDFLRDRARTLRGGGLEGEELFKAVMSLNSRLTSPKTEEDVRRAIGNVMQFPPDPPPIVLNVPTKDELTGQQALAAQTASLQTLATLPYGTPPLPLVLGTFIAPEGWTVVYANGGTGKGLLALWMMRHVLVEKPESTICVIDYEGHKWEWGNRARAIGWTQEELERVFYIDPYDPVWKKGHTLAGIAPELRLVGDDLGVGLYVVDSYTTAASSEAELGGAKGAVEFFKGGASLGAPGLVLAHTSAGDGERFPAKPFGSVFVHNLARETWAGAQMSSESGLIVPGLFGVSATSIQVELRNKKRSAGGKTLAQQGFDITFRSNGDIRIEYQQNYERPVRDLILDVLATTSSGMTAKAMSAAIKEDTGRDIDETTLRRVIARGVDGISEDASRRPKTYSLEDESEAS